MGYNRVLRRRILFVLRDFVQGINAFLVPVKGGFIISGLFRALPSQ
jgi:hypothetical protein